ncbi:MAG: acyl carrier protein [Solobacterium sp.]|jgi:acyl carrier protein|nr:acyl carrier protein [Solobacterium sp.]MCH4048243.1 acyl carrier protein [Solobacterium sp.]MCH4074903.1 acyl carrier protein [Solobacterium sp.]MCI1314013.1 acyl carrier protein [Solobacterium sp.]MCI1346094.1 acyl carrier protein [Solobacterium sp.]
MLEREEVIQGVITVIRDNVPEMFGSDLNENTVLNEHGNVDSMGFILIVTKLEGKYDVHIPDEAWISLTTVGDLADAILKYSER